MHVRTDNNETNSVSKFDRERDMGRKVLDPTQRMKMINDSKDFSSRFTTPKFN